MRQPNIKEIQIQLTGFLNKDCASFCKELWNLMLSAQESPRGVPKEMLEAKKLELQQEQVWQSELPWDRNASDTSLRQIKLQLRVAVVKNKSRMI